MQNSFIHMEISLSLFQGVKLQLLAYLFSGLGYDFSHYISSFLFIVSSYVQRYFFSSDEYLVNEMYLC